MKRRKRLPDLPKDTTYKDARTTGQEYTAQLYTEAQKKMPMPRGRRLRRAFNAKYRIY